MQLFKGPNDLLHGDEHLEELEDWELRERFFSALRDLTAAEIGRASCRERV